MAIDIDEVQNMIFIKTKISELYNSDISASKIFLVSIKWMEKGYRGLKEYTFVTNTPVDYDSINNIIKENKEIKKILAINVEPIDYFNKG